MMRERRIHSILIALTVHGLLLSGCVQDAPRGLLSPEVPDPATQPHKSMLALDQLPPPISRPTTQPSQELPEDLRAELLPAKKLLIGARLTGAVDREKLAKAAETLERAAKITPDDLSIHFALGRWYAANKEGERAILAFRTGLKCSQARPDSPLAAESLLRLGNLLSEKGYHLAALECLTELEERIYRHGGDLARSARLRSLVIRPERVMRRRGRLLLKLDRSDEAADLLERAFRYDRGHPQTARLLIEALVAARQFARAEDIFVEIAAEPAQRPQLPALAESLCIAARDRTMPRRIADSLRSRKQLDGALAVELAKIAGRLGANQEAVTLLESLLEIAPGDADAARFLAGLYAADGQQEKALRLLARLIAEDPSAADAVRLAVEELLARPTPVDIERSFALQIRGETAEKKFALHYVAAQLAQVRGEPLLAAQEYRNAIAENPKFLPTYEALADLYLATGQQDRLGWVLRRAASGDGNSYFGHYLTGKVRFTQEDYLLAEDALKQARTRGRRHLPTLLLLGRTYLALSETREAIRIFEEAAQAAPGDERTYRWLFEAYLAGGRHSRADQIVRGLRRRKGPTPTGALLRTKLLLRTGRSADARKAVAELRRMSPDNRELPLLSIQVELAEKKGPLSDDDLESMVRRLSVLVRRDPGSDVPRRTLMELLGRGGKGLEAGTAAVWNGLYEQTSGQRGIAKIYAASLIALDRREEALPIMRDLVARNPLDLISQRVLLHMLTKLGQTDEAARRCREVQAILDERIEALSDKRRVHSLRGEKFRLYAVVGLYDELATFGREWIAAAPENTGLKRLLVSALADGEQSDKGHALLDEWIAAPDQHLTAYRRMKVALYAQAGQFDEAESFALQWIQSEPDLSLPRLTLVSTLIGADKLERAQELVDEWVARFTTTAPSTLPTQPAPTTAPKGIARWSREWAVRLLVIRREYEEGLRRLERYVPIDATNEQLLVLKSSCLSELGRTKEAILAMEAALRLRPDSAELQNNLGYMYADYGIQLDKAERLIRRALAESPTQIAYQDSLGWVFYKKGKFAEAGRVFEQILSSPAYQQRDHPVILDHAGDTMWRLGRKSKAISLWRTALKLAAKQQMKVADVRRVLENAGKKIEVAEGDRPPALAPIAEDTK